MGGSIGNFALIGYGKGYPLIEYLDDVIVIEKNLGNIKHHIPIKEVFGKSLRIIVLSNLIGQTITVKCVIYGKNLQKPIEKDLKLHVKEN